MEILQSKNTIIEEKDRYLGKEDVMEAGCFKDLVYTILRAQLTTLITVIAALNGMTHPMVLGLGHNHPTLNQTSSVQ